jgi:hypothetical protein
MRGKGINYDTGVRSGGKSSRELFDPAEVEREMQVIARDLHCTAVRITGGDVDRISVAAEHAAAAGLEVWFAPFPCDLSIAQMLPYFADCAARAQDVNKHSAQEVVLVLGCEISVAAEGFLPGTSIYERLASLRAPTPEMYATYPSILARTNGHLGEAARVARHEFSGRLTYASGLWEQIDWTPFDIVAVDAYRDAGNAGTYREQLRSYTAHHKPVAATEFGCCTYRGASDRGGSGWAIVDESVTPWRLEGTYVRNEQEQATYLREVLQILDEEGVDTAFWFTFAGYRRPHRSDPAYDLDMASYGVVKLLEDGPTSMRWEPKAVFNALAAAYTSPSYTRA